MDLWYMLEDLALVHAPCDSMRLIGVGCGSPLRRPGAGMLRRHSGLGSGGTHGPSTRLLGQTSEIGGGEEAEVALDDAALVSGQAFGLFSTQGGCRRFIVDSCGIQWLAQPFLVLSARPFVFERHQLG